MNESNVILRLFVISMIVNNAAMNILRAASLHSPLIDPSIFPQDKMS